MDEPSTPDACIADAPLFPSSDLGIGVPLEWGRTLPRSAGVPAWLGVPWGGEAQTVPGGVPQFRLTPERRDLYFQCELAVERSAVGQKAEFDRARRGVTGSLSPEIRSTPG